MKWNDQAGWISAEEELVEEPCANQRNRNYAQSVVGLQLVGLNSSFSDWNIYN